MGQLFSTVPCSRLHAVAHGGNPQDRAASLFPVTDFCNKSIQKNT
ncbi:hypothetical protein [Moorena sp. SIO3I6]|nr:hypothetical protein [Moorena sp. SIO3I6]